MPTELTLVLAEDKDSNTYVIHAKIGDDVGPALWHTGPIPNLTTIERMRWQDFPVLDLEGAEVVDAEGKPVTESRWTPYDAPFDRVEWAVNQVRTLISTTLDVGDRSR